MASMDSRAIEGEIDRIRSLGLEELRREWRRLNHAEPPRISRDLLVNGPGWPHTEPQPEARRASGSGMARPYAHRHDNGGWGRVCRDELSIPDQDRQKDHRGALVGSALLWAISGRCGAPEQWEAR